MTKTPACSSRLNSMKDKIIGVLKNNTIAEGAKILKVSRGALYHFIERNKLPGFSIKKKKKYKIEMPPEQVSTLLEKYSIKETALILGVPQSTLYRFKKRYDLKNNIRQSRLMPIKAQVIELLKNNSVADCARILNVPRNTLYSFIRRCAIQDIVLKRKIRNKLEDVSKDQIIALLEKNSVTVSAEFLGVSRWVLHFFMKKHGLNEKYSKRKLALIKDRVTAILEKNSVKESAKLLNVPCSTLYGFIKKHGLKIYDSRKRKRR